VELAVRGSTLSNEVTGVIAGSNTLKMQGALLVNNGTIRPGGSPGLLAVTGGIRLGDSSVLEIELGGLTKFTEYDHMQLLPDANTPLNGTLRVSLIDEFVPAAGNEFEIMSTETALEGQFSIEQLPGLEGELGFQVDYGPKSVVIRVVGTGDSDGDGLPDAWEEQFFGDATSADPDADGDGDGARNLAEYIADTVPTNGNSVLRLEIMSETSSPDRVLTFDASSRRAYTLEFNPVIDPLGWTTLDEQSGTSGPVSFTDAADDDRRYYRVGVRLP